jgi:hypothetical protein
MSFAATDHGHNRFDPPNVVLTSTVIASTIENVASTVMTSGE